MTDGSRVTEGSRETDGSREMDGGVPGTGAWTWPTRRSWWELFQLWVLLAADAPSVAAANRYVYMYTSPRFAAVSLEGVHVAAGAAGDDPGKLVDCLDR